MKIVIAGGSGYIGELLTNYFSENHQIIILSRDMKKSNGNVKFVQWDFKNIDFWAMHLDNADVLINLAGKNINCRFTEENKIQIVESRVHSIEALNQAISLVNTAPKLWINASSASIFPDSRSSIYDEDSTEVGNGFLENVISQWESAFDKINLPNTRKVNARIGLVLGAKSTTYRLMKIAVYTGMGGGMGNGSQWVSWISEDNLIKAFEYVILKNSILGKVHLVGPEPILNKDLFANIRKSLHIPFGLSIPIFLLNIACAIMGNEPVLVLESRRVVPKKLLRNGFIFDKN